MNLTEFTNLAKYEGQRIDEVFSGSGFDWEVDADFKYATFSAKFKIDDSTFNLSFYSSALRMIWLT